MLGRIEVGLAGRYKSTWPFLLIPIAHANLNRSSVRRRVPYDGCRSPSKMTSHRLIGFLFLASDNIHTGRE